MMEPVTSTPGFISGNLRLILRLEGLSAFVLALIIYDQLSFSWGIFVLCFLLPDLSFLGYLGGQKTGARFYNAAHSYIIPVLLIALDLSGYAQGLIKIGIIWIAHIGFDRMLGYGLKYESGFTHTHLGKIGKNHNTSEQINE